MKFGAPEFIKWLLLIIPLAAVFFWMHRQRTARLAQLIPDTAQGKVIPGYTEKRNRRRTALRLAALFCILLALTRPQWGFHWDEVKHRGLDILIVLDTSRSMLTQDIRPDRLQQAKWAVRDFVRHLKGDRIGLIAFAGSSFLQCPVTADYAAFNMMLNDLYAGIIPRGGTAIEQALRTAAESFDLKSGADRVIILITDGEDHEGDPLRMTGPLRKDNIKLFCIGVGTPDGELIPAPDGYVKDAQGRVIKSSLNEVLLERLARETGGFYVRSAPGDFGLDRIYRLGIAGLQRDEQETRLAKVYEERFVWFAAAALLFLLAEGFIKTSKTALLLLLLAGAQQAESADWVKAYRKGDYQSALQSLEASGDKSDTAEYNRGNILYRMKDFQGAEKAFGAAAAQTAEETLRQKAIYNRGTTLLAEIAQRTDATQSSNMLDSVEQAIRLFEQSLELRPNDTTAKQKLEQALNMMVSGRVALARNLLDEAEQILSQDQAKQAKENCEAAKKLLNPVIEDYAPDNTQAALLITRADRMLTRLEQAIAQTKEEMINAQHAIDLYEYQAAADVMLADRPERRWAFDLDEKLAQEFQQLIENNSNVMQIIYPNRYPQP